MKSFIEFITEGKTAHFKMTSDESDKWEMLPKVKDIKAAQKAAEKKYGKDEDLTIAGGWTHSDDKRDLGPALAGGSVNLATRAAGGKWKFTKDYKKFKAAFK